MSEVTFSAEQVAQAFQRVRRNLELERRQQFQAFGVAAECAWPCSRVYHEQSSIGPAWTPQLSLDEIAAHTRNLAYKSYPEAERFALPYAEPLQASLEATIRARRSVRDFSERAVSLSALAKLLELGCGVMEIDAIPRRAAPSGGGLYPVESYVLSFAVEGLECALWHYHPLTHALERLRAVSGPAVLQPFMPPGLLGAPPPLVLVQSLVFARTQTKYLERGYRFGLLESGHIAQNLLLGAVALGLAAAPIGGFWDDPFNELLGLDPEREAVVYSVLVGHAAAHSEQP
jgi:SagB-type dehydrogenase family enzyme